MDKWLKRGKLNIKQPPSVLLPDPTKIEDTDKACSLSAANDAVADLTSECELRTTPSRKRNRSGQYNSYSPEVRLRIAKTCLEIGGVNMVPCGNWTMEEKGSKQVPVKGMDDKRQITLLLVFSKSGSVPPPQVIYAGLTDQCHPKYTFPEGWDIFHSPSHWSTEETMLRYVENVIVPYIDHVREEDDLPLRQRALCIFDVYKAHRGQSLLDLLDRNGTKAVFVPGACTDRVQPLDPIPNNLFKSYLKAEFLSFYGDEIQKQLAAGTDLSDIKIDLRTSVVKPLHAQWLV